MSKRDTPDEETNDWSRVRENRTPGSEGGEGANPSRPLSKKGPERRMRGMDYNLESRN
jgi:hypothetical protein